MRALGDSLDAMKRIVFVALLAAVCAPEPKASRVEVAPLPTPETSTGGTSTKDGRKRAPDGDMRLDVHEGVGDRDGDGIKDSMDKCPDDPEDRDGFEDEDGCPDPDNGRDGILDRDDKCPNQPEVFNGVTDDDGCPP